jgi:ADP-ribose pyrophosphatase
MSTFRPNFSFRDRSPLSPIDWNGASKLDTTKPNHRTAPHRRSCTMTDINQVDDDSKSKEHDHEADVLAENNDNDHNNNDISHPRLSPCAVTSRTEVARTRWISLQTLKWTDPHGTVRQWDCASRTTKRHEQAVDAVIIIPLLQGAPSQPIETLLVEQYRPPVGTVTLEFPAGLIDVDETVEQAALRELREETGYVGKPCRTIVPSSQLLCMSPGLCDETVQVVLVDVDLSNPENHGTPTPQLDNGEFCTVRRVTLQQGMRDILEASSSLSSSNRTNGGANAAMMPMPIMGLYTFALGYELGQQQQQQDRQDQQQKTQR